MKRYTLQTLPHSAEYIGSTEGPDTMSEFLADLLADAIAPAFITEPDGSRSFFELCTEPATDHSRSNGPHQ